MPPDLIVDCFGIANGDIERFCLMLSRNGVSQGNAVGWYKLLEAALEKWNGEILPTTGKGPPCKCGNSDFDVNMGMVMCKKCNRVING